MPWHERTLRPIHRLELIARSLRDLGPVGPGLLAIYRLGLVSGHYRRTLTERFAKHLADAVSHTSGETAGNAQPAACSTLWDLPARADLSALLGLAGREQLLAEAQRIVSGEVILFGGLAAPLRLDFAGPLQHWTFYESGDLSASGRPESDIKLIWEPARFGWAFTLGRAYRLTGDDQFAQAFWQRLEAFLDANPPYLGPHWASAQEVGLRLIAFTFALDVFRDAAGSSPERVLRLRRAIAIHAGRIPPTLVYARAQNNNHLLSEATALITAAARLPQHPQAPAWRSTGWKWFNRSLLAQIAADGAYCQHSANYQRLMLQLGLWVTHLSQRGGGLEPEANQRLAAATRWLLALTDPSTGRVPNLGPNDGAYIFPLTNCPFEDYRPVLQAASAAFCSQPAFEAGAWDELQLWLGGDLPAVQARPATARAGQGAAAGQTPHVLHSPDGASWAYLRAARFNGRPGHADQLHLDLWWRGLNVAQDAGTYLYNAPPPWDNSLTRSEVHNTVTIDGRNQMTRAGKFLYLDWAQAEILPTSPDGVDSFAVEDKNGDPAFAALTARHNGFRRSGVWHARTLICHKSGRWEIIDRIDPVRPPGATRVTTAVLHWLLPDWAFDVDENANDRGVELRLDAPLGRLRLGIRLDQAGDDNAAGTLQIARAGELLAGSGPVSPTWGWASPTYAVKVPALAIRFSVTAPLPIGFTSEVSFPPTGGT